VGILSARKLTDSGAASTLNHRIIYNPDTIALLYDADGVGDVYDPVLFALNYTGVSLTAGMFKVFEP